MILNSCIGTFFHFNFSPKATKGDFPKILVKDVNGFPLPKDFDKINKNLFSKLYKVVAYSKAGENLNVDFQRIVDTVSLNLYFPDHMKERQIDVLDFVEEEVVKRKAQFKEKSPGILKVIMES